MKNDHLIAIEINGLNKQNHYSRNTELPTVEVREAFSAKIIQLYHTDQAETEIYALRGNWRIDGFLQTSSKNQCRKIQKCGNYVNFFENCVTTKPVQVCIFIQISFTKT